MTSRRCRVGGAEESAEALGEEARHVTWLERCLVMPGDSGAPVLDADGRLPRPRPRRQPALLRASGGHLDVPDHGALMTSNHPGWSSRDPGRHRRSHAIGALAALGAGTSVWKGLHDRLLTAAAIVAMLAASVHWGLLVAAAGYLVAYAVTAWLGLDAVLYASSASNMVLFVNLVVLFSRSPGTRKPA